MPEAAVHENDPAKFRKYQVWFARQVFRVQTIAVPHTEHGLADYQFRFCVLATDTSHVLAAALPADGIHLDLRSFAIVPLRTVWKQLNPHLHAARAICALYFTVGGKLSFPQGFNVTV